MQIKKHFGIFVYAVITAVLVCVLLNTPDATAVFTGTDIQWDELLNTVFKVKDDTLLSGNADQLKTLYVQNERNSRWAIEAEINRSRYIRSWSERQGVTFKSIASKIVKKQMRRVGRGYAFYVVVSTEYTYAYDNEPDKVNLFRIGTYHSLDLIPGSTEGSWLISREWYLDPFQDSLHAKGLKADEVKEFIMSQTAPDYAKLPERRAKTIAYADRYAGAASGGEFGYQYNTKYPNYNHRGGDCSNYISQTLHEGGGFKTGGGWSYAKDSASRSWCNASGLHGYLVYSGRASVIAKGTFSKVYKTAYKLVPGDVIAYEEKGKVVHMAIVTAVDSKGYPLVNTHTTDRFHVPWDLGWNDDDIRFFLLKVHYPS